MCPDLPRVLVTGDEQERTLFVERRISGGIVVQPVGGTRRARGRGQLVDDRTRPSLVVDDRRLPYGCVDARGIAADG